MIGAHEQGEVSFMNALPIKQRTAATYLINQFEVVDLVDLFYNGPTLQLQQDFSLEDADWSGLICSVLLTRLTLFHPNFQYPKSYVKFLLALSFKAYCQLHQGQLELSAVADHAERDFPYFSSWFKQLLSLYQSQK